MEIFITGAANGIGKATAEKLASRGHRVTGFDIDDSVHNIPGIESIQGDVYNEERVKDVLEGRDIDVLINCAGYYEMGSVEDMDAETVESHFNANVFGLLNVTRNAIPVLRENSGRIVNVSSVTGRVAMPFFGPYAATKHSIEALSDSMRLELASFDVDVVVVEPGPVETGFNERARKKLEKYVPESVYSDRYEKILESGGMEGISAEEAAETVVKAVETRNPRARYTTGFTASTAIFLDKYLPSRVRDFLVEKFY